MAVFNVLAHKDMVPLSRAEQLRVACTAAIATRVTAEVSLPVLCNPLDYQIRKHSWILTCLSLQATCRYIAKLYQERRVPSEQVLASAGAGTLSDFLNSVGNTVAAAVMRVVSFILDTTTSSTNMNYKLSTNVPAELSFSTTSFHELDVRAKLSFSTGLVQSLSRSQSSNNNEKDVRQLANQIGIVGAQAAFDTFVQKSAQLEHRANFCKTASDLANNSPALLAALSTTTIWNNVSGCDRSRSETRTHYLPLLQVDSLRQFALEISVSACANMLAENNTVEILDKVHSLRNELTFRSDEPSELLMVSWTSMQLYTYLLVHQSAVPIAACIAESVTSAMLALLWRIN